MCSQQARNSTLFQRDLGISNWNGSWFLKEILWLGLLLAPLSPGIVLARESWQTTNSKWQAQYWNNTNLSGPAVVERFEESISYVWETGAPDPRIKADGFSARWTRYIETGTGTYRFTVTSDDGIRVRLDGDTIIDEWYDHSSQTFTVVEELRAGLHWIVVEYYENLGWAMVKMTWPGATTEDLPWHGYYYDNPTLSGVPVVTRDESEINWDWSLGSPFPEQMGVDQFSIRWTRLANLPAGTYRFEMTVDDGGRLWVNNNLLLDAWKVQSPTTYAGDIYVPGGTTPVRMEYFEYTGTAHAQLKWTPVFVGDAWSAQYFDNQFLSGLPTVERDEGRLDHDWGTRSPSPSLPADGFSARWTRYFSTEPEVYRFTVTSDDGVRVWVDDDLIADLWYDHPAQVFAVEKELNGAYHCLKVEYYDDMGVASVKLEWAPAKQPSWVMVDDTDPGFEKSGSPSQWRTAAAGYGDHVTWTLHDSMPETDGNWGRWSPHLTEGRYQVLAYISPGYGTTEQAQYIISYADGYALKVVNQAAGGGRWVSLGFYRFRGTRDDWVLLFDLTGEPAPPRIIGYDAMLWVRQ